MITRSALRDLRGTASPASRPATTRSRAASLTSTDAFLVVQEGGGLNTGDRIDLFGGVSLGRSADADVRMDDRFASGIHGRVFNRGNGVLRRGHGLDQRHLLNSQELHGEAELRQGDEIQIGDTVFRFELS